ncbi:hypothetical protein Pst134EB_020536 [Puccinia striiformis f. sp. tritici]|nr:hypothetical protein Pst134EB_020536 [Puccinia striiformis f. sp. tritici]
MALSAVNLCNIDQDTFEAMAPVRGVDTMGGGGAAANGRPIPIRVSISYRKVPKLRYFARI